MNTASQLYVSDLDGTLLNRDGHISDLSHSLLSQLIADGLPFTVASARSVVTIREVLRGLPIRLPVIEMNGACLSDLATGRHLHCETIPTDVAQAIIADGNRHGMTPVVATYDGQADHVYLLPPRNEGVAGYVTGRMAAGDRRLRQVDSLAPSLHEAVICLTYMDRREYLEPFCDQIRLAYGDHIRPLLFPEQYFPPWYWLAIYSAQATKAHAIQRLALDLNIGLPEITVFGDQINDLPMFETCGRAVAVANAVPELLPHADETIGHHNDNSVARYLHATWNG